VHRLHLVLNPRSDSFCDYTVLPWFMASRETGGWPVRAGERQGAVANRWLVTGIATDEANVAALWAGRACENAELNRVPRRLVDGAAVAFQCWVTDLLSQIFGRPSVARSRSTTVGSQQVDYALFGKSTIPFLMYSLVSTERSFVASILS